MKFFSMIINPPKVITIPKRKYSIVRKPSLPERLAVWLKILLIVSLSLWAGVEHLDFVFNRKIEKFIFGLAMSFCMKSLHKIPA